MPAGLDRQGLDDHERPQMRDKFARFAEGGRIEQRNFDTYNVVRLADMPAVEVIVMPSGGFWGGVGEPTIAVAAPAVLNALFVATGKRVRHLPLKNTDLNGVKVAQATFSVLRVHAGASSPNQ